MGLHTQHLRVLVMNMRDSNSLLGKQDFAIIHLSDHSLTVQAEEQTFSILILDLHLRDRLDFIAVGGLTEHLRLTDDQVAVGALHKRLFPIGDCRFARSSLHPQIMTAG